MQLVQAGKFILKKLKKELPAHLSYHNIDHTTDVHEVAGRIARGEAVSNHDLKLLLTAALFHDTGFIKMRIGHEAESCRIARQYLPGYNYKTEEIEAICGMIMATKVPQAPKTALEKILCDADLDYLGRNDFFILSCKLFAELCADGLIETEVEWDREQIEFMAQHHYHTATSVKLRQPKKEEYIKLVKSRI